VWGEVAPSSCTIRGMRFEQVPLLLGGFVGLIGLLLVADALLPERARLYARERRRRVRTERHRVGEALVGLGIVAMGGALIGRDAWRWSTVVVIAGAVLLVLGAVLNFRYLRETFAFRGRARRGVEQAAGENAAAEPGDRPSMRIR
jgi:phosphatidylglycerophosphate synthase